MKRKLTVACIALLTIICGGYLTQSVFAAQRGMRHGEWGNVGEGKMHENAPYWRHLNDLALNEKQKAEVKEIRNSVMKETIRKRADMRIDSVELREILDRAPVDMKKVEEKLKQIELLRTDIRLSHIRAMEEVKAKLTPEQREKFKDLCEMKPVTGGRDKKDGMRHGFRRMPPPLIEEEAEK